MMLPLYQWLAVGICMIAVLCVTVAFVDVRRFMRQVREEIEHRREEMERQRGQTFLGAPFELREVQVEPRMVQADDIV